MLSALLGDGPDLRRHLSRLIDAELLFADGEPPEATYRFKHALVQDAAYESLLRSTRQTYHRSIAQTLQQHFASLAQAQPAKQSKNRVE